MSATFAAAGHAILEAPAVHEAAFLSWGRELAARIIAEYTEDPSEEELAAISEDVARAALVTTQGSLYRKGLLPTSS